MRYGQIYDTEIGRLCILQEGEAIVVLDIAEHTSDADLTVIWQETPLLKEAISQVQEYLSGSRRTFTLPYRFEGTVFQEKVWQALLEIPYDETRTYGQIAARIGNPKGARAVGMACNRNRILLLIPCHRVIGSDGSLTGFGGGIEVKRSLLELEHRKDSLST